MVLTVFRNRLREDAGPEYADTLQRMLEIVAAMPGYIQHKVYIAADGERCTIVEFDTEEHQRAWATNTEHVRAKAKGRESFYSEYRLQVCTVQRDSRFRKA